MNRKIAVLCMMLLLLFSACKQQRGSVYEVPAPNGSVFTVNMENNTITGSREAYHFDYQDSTITFRYPNGQEASWTQDENGITIDYSDGFDVNTMMDVSVLANMLPPPVQEKPLVGFLLAMLSLVLGALTVIFPKKLWYALVGWQVKDMVPSKTLLCVYRIGGVVLMLVGIAALIF